MIRYVELGDQVNDDTFEFAFVDTVTMRFVEVAGVQVFESREDLVAALDTAETPPTSASACSTSCRRPRRRRLPRRCSAAAPPRAEDTVRWRYTSDSLKGWEPPTHPRTWKIEWIPLDETQAVQWTPTALPEPDPLPAVCIARTGGVLLVDLTMAAGSTRLMSRDEGATWALVPYTNPASATPGTPTPKAGRSPQ